MVVKRQQEVVGCSVLERNGPCGMATVNPRSADSCLTGVWAHHCLLIFQMQSLRQTIFNGLSCTGQTNYIPVLVHLGCSNKIPD